MHIRRGFINDLRLVLAGLLATASPGMQERIELLRIDMEKAIP